MVFDFGNVLYSVDYPAMARALAGDRGPQLLEAFVGSTAQVAYETGRAGLEDVLGELARLGFPCSRGRFLEAYLGVFAPIPGVSLLLERLAGCRPLGLLSNTSPEHARLFIETTPEASLFRARVYSFEVGCMKPDPRTYREVARRLGMPPSALVYTDDVTAYADGATAAGMKGMVFRGAEDLRRQLVHLGCTELGGLRA
ncbi:MAG: HAD-IA family hydrolase [Deferrisomatales bacterium]|nr:HAD-IA family hydrolase [Deferrisomatales bacterium]